MREIVLRDPAFRIDSHERFMREIAIPSILDSLVTGDLPALRTWCSDAAFRAAKASIDSRLVLGSRLDGRILDMRHVELASVRLLDDRSPALVYTLTAQQVVPVRDLIDGALVSGRDDTVEHVVYVMAFSIEHPSVSVANRAMTRGWRLVEFVARERNAW
jgi:import inner membrane translocase subunit TIM44